MSRPLRAVQIGAGSFCRQFHAPTLQRLASGDAPRISLEAICDLDPDRAGLFAREFGYARVFEDFRRLAFSHRPVHRRVMQQVAPVMSRITAIEQSRDPRLYRGQHLCHVHSGPGSEPSCSLA